MRPLDTVNVSGKSIKAAITDECVVLTVIDLPKGVPAMNRAGVDVKEHDSFLSALEYLKDECADGEWDRVYIINPERLRYREDNNGCRD